MPHEHNSSQFGEGLCNVEVTERADFEKRNAKSLCKGLGMLGSHLALICQVKPVPHQDLGYTWCMLETEQSVVFKELSLTRPVLFYVCIETTAVIINHF